MVDRRGRGIGAALAGLLVVGGLGACGGGGDGGGAYGLAMPTTTTEAEPERSEAEQRFVEAGEAICAEEIGPFAGLPEARSADAALDRVRAYEEAVAGALLRLRELTPPPGSGAQYDALLTAVAEVREAVVEVIASLEAEDPARLDAAADRLGQESLEADLLSIAVGLEGCAG